MKKRFLNLNRFYILKADGQALLFVIVAMTVALAVGVNVSLRTLSSVSRTAQSDTSERVLAAAEGGAESFIKLSVGQLEAISDAFDTDTVADYLCDDAGDDVSYDPIRKECFLQFSSWHILHNIHLEGRGHLKGLSCLDVRFRLFLEKV